jgi:hypothetical protein
MAFVRPLWSENRCWQPTSRRFNCVEMGQADHRNTRCALACVGMPWNRGRKGGWTNDSTLEKPEQLWVILYESYPVLYRMSSS